MLHLKYLLPILISCLVFSNCGGQILAKHKLGNITEEDLEEFYKGDLDSLSRTQKLRTVEELAFQKIVNLKATQEGFHKNKDFASQWETKRTRAGNELYLTHLYNAT